MKGQAMAKIIKFPSKSRTELNQKTPAKSALTPTKGRSRPVKFSGAMKVLWVAAVLLWPWVRWIAVLDVLFQFGRMVYHWNTLGAFAGWTFLLHFGVLTAITYFVSMFKPNDL